MQTFDKIKLHKMVIHAYTKTYYTKNDRFDIEQTFNTQFVTVVSERELIGAVS